MPKVKLSDKEMELIAQYRRENPPETKQPLLPRAMGKVFGEGWKAYVMSFFMGVIVGLLL